MCDKLSISFLVSGYGFASGACFAGVAFDEYQDVLVCFAEFAVDLKAF